MILGGFKWQRRKGGREVKGDKLGRKIRSNEGVKEDGREEKAQYNSCSKQYRKFEKVSSLAINLAAMIHKQRGFSHLMSPSFLEAKAPAVEKAPAVLAPTCFNAMFVFWYLQHTRYTH